MNKQFFDKQKELLSEGYIEILEKVKMICYKMDKSFFETFDFNNPKIYNEPVLFSLLNDKQPDINTIYSYFLGYQNGKLQKTGLLKTNTTGQIYLPNIGWLHTGLNDENLKIDIDSSGKISAYKLNGEIVAHFFEPPLFLNEGEIEVYKYSLHPFVKSYYDEFRNPVAVEIKNVTKKFLPFLKIAYHYIKKHIPSHYELINKYANKCVVFKEPSGRRNSFADFAAHGTGFYNAYQEEYNEVFFIDDIAHQTGHVLMNTMAKEIQKFIKISSSTKIQDIYYQGEIVETRSIEVVFHALYTYYTTFICLNACLENGVFTKLKRFEALGRMKFYLFKCYKDLLLIKKLNISFEENESDIFTEKGHIIINNILKTWDIMNKKWGKEVDSLILNRQPYNFTNKIFYEENDLL
jgi:hypothetical protein